MKFFSVDGKIYRFISRFWDLIKLNFLWLVCSLPIVTIGVSTTAAFSVMLKIIDDHEGYVARTFFKEFKANFKQGLVIGIISIIFIGAVVCDFLLSKSSVGFAILGVLSGFMFSLALVYTYPLLARYENTVINSIKNSLKISFKYFGRTFFMIFICVVEAIIFSYPNFITLFVGILIGPMCIVMTIAANALIFFREIEKSGGAIVRNEDNELETDDMTDSEEEKETENEKN